MRWLAVIVGTVALVGLLYWQFPYAAQKPVDQFHVLYSALLLIFVVGNAAVLRRQNVSTSVEYMLAWLGIILVLVAGYGYRDEILQSRVVAELMPQRVQISADGSIRVRAAVDGHFHIVATVNGAEINFLVDTGASDVILSMQDAQRAGFSPGQLHFTRTYSTANGSVGGAPVTLNEMQVGKVIIRGMEASVNGGELDGSLLGMRFLRQFRSFRIEGNTLTLTP